MTSTPDISSGGHTRPVLIVEMDQIELACRIAEAVMGLTRPKNKTARQALDTFDPDVHLGFMNAAYAAMKYLEECTSRGSGIQ